jgi:hypothetical protein
MEYFNSDGARTGLFFGATSGVITTIGLIVGLNSGTRSITAVLGWSSPLPMRCPMHLEYTSLKNRIPILITVTSGPRRS